MLLLLACLLLPLPARATNPDAAFWEAKGAYFKALLDEVPAGITASRARLVAASAERAEAAERRALARDHAPEPRAEPYVPEPGYRFGELDMLQVKPELKKQLVAIYAEASRSFTSLAAKRAAELRALAAAQGESRARKQKLRALFEKELAVALESSERCARAIAASGIDRDYAYRALLREHRRRRIQ